MDKNFIMNTSDKKEEILQKLQSTTDEQLIEEVYDLLKSNKAVEVIQANDLAPELQNKIIRALDDYKNGRYITHEQMKQKLEQWLTN
jgi:ribosome-binding protein aMBF1 (putative translation factor)